MGLAHVDVDWQHEEIGDGCSVGGACGHPSWHLSEDSDCFHAEFWAFVVVVGLDIGDGAAGLDGELDKQGYWCVEG